MFLVFYKKALLSSPSESASNGNSEEQLLEKFLEKSAKFLSSKDANCMAIPCNFTFNKISTILALSFSLIDLIGFNSFTTEAKSNAEQINGLVSI